LSVSVARQQQPCPSDTTFPLANKAVDSNREKLGFMRLSLFFQFIAFRQNRQGRLAFVFGPGFIVDIVKQKAVSPT
jgi:hypothetical protein